MLKCFFLANAVIFSKTNKTDSAKAYFDKTYSLAKDNKDFRFLELAIEERLLSEVDNGDKQKQTALLNELLKIKQLQNEASSEMVTSISEKNDNIISNYSFKLKRMIVLSAISIVVLLVLLYLYIRKERKTKARFIRIIQNLEKQKSENLIPDVNEENTELIILPANFTENKIDSDYQKVISPEKGNTG